MSPDGQDNVDESEIVRRVRDILGARLTAYSSASRKPGMFARADRTEAPSPEVSQRLRLTFRIASKMAANEGKEVTQVWFTGLNPLLEDVSPGRLIRELHTGDARILVIGAAERFIVGG